MPDEHELEMTLGLKEQESLIRAAWTVMQGKQYLTEMEAAYLLGVSEARIAAHVESGVLVVYRVAADTWRLKRWDVSARLPLKHWER